MSIVRTSAIASVVAQLLIGVVTSIGFFVNVTEERDRENLNIVLAFEVSSQAIEFVWYASVLLVSATITARLRYLDWVFSTPIMLISLGLFFHHRRADGSAVTSIFETFEIYACLVVNWIMLAFGYAMETGRIPRTVGLGGGGLALVGSFTFLAVLVPIDTVSHVLFWVTLGVWGLYGVAAALDEVSKNVMYNAIDVVSKNGFGLFLFTYTLTRS